MSNHVMPLFHSFYFHSECFALIAEDCSKKVKRSFGLFRDFQTKWETTVMKCGNGIFSEYLLNYFIWSRYFRPVETNFHCKTYRFLGWKMKYKLCIADWMGRLLIVEIRKQVRCTKFGFICIHFLELLQMLFRNLYFNGKSWSKVDIFFF